MSGYILGSRFIPANVLSEGVRWTKRSVSDGSASFLLFVRVVLPESAQEAPSGRSPGGQHKNLLQFPVSLCRMVLRGLE
jgi:hypothetical protein